MDMLSYSFKVPDRDVFDIRCEVRNCGGLAALNLAVSRSNVDGLFL
jgi:hypothetical protein